MGENFLKSCLDLEKNKKNQCSPFFYCGNHPRSCNIFLTNICCMSEDDIKGQDYHQDI